jgi:DHA2 family multidrug resistance protein-like MFS transporter
MLKTIRDAAPDIAGRFSLRPPSRTVEADGLPQPRRGWAYTAIILGITLAVLDATVANVALPTMAAAFHATPARSVDIVSAYQLTIVMLLLPLAALGDIYGYRRVYLGGLAVFTFASLACASADSITTLTAARIFQGFGAAGIMSVNIAFIRYIFPQNHLGRAIGFNAMVVAISSTLGPSFASVVLGFASWRWLFAVNIPLGVAALIIGSRYLPYSNRTPQKFDLLSAVLTAAALGLLISSASGFSHGGRLPLQGAEFALGLAAVLWSVARQWHLPAPLLPVDLLRIPLFALTIGTSICSFTAQMLAFVALPFFMQSGLGFSVTEIGFLIMPWPFAVGLAAPVAGLLADRFPAAILGLIGLMTLAAGLVLLSLLTPHPALANVAWRMAVCGIGFGLFQSPNNRTLLMAAPRPRSGAASGMLGTARLLGQTVGAVLVALTLAHFPAHGAQFALWLGAGFAASAGGLSILRMV